MRSGDLDAAPIFEDVRVFDGRSLRGSISVISGGSPCQDLSVAGKRAGIIEGERSGLWREYARIVGEVRPKFVLLENVPGLLADGALGIVLGDLAKMGYDAEWDVFSACEVGAPHTRERVFLVAYTAKDEHVQHSLGDSSEIARWRTEPSQWGADRIRPQVDPVPSLATEWGKEILCFPEPPLLRVADGVDHRMDRLGCSGNGVVPQESAPAWAFIKKIAGGG
jgi:DNA (cytosine-5)-methyltransferase 1